MAPCVYMLCAITSTACSILLTRAFLRGRGKLLLWSSLCFAGLALSNAVLFVDLIIVPDIDLSLMRGSIGFFSMVFLVFGLVWDVEAK